VVLGLVFDADIRMPYVVLCCVTGTGVLVCIALAPLVPRSNKAKPLVASPAQTAVPDKASEPPSVAGSEDLDPEAAREASLSDSAEKWVMTLRARQAVVTQKLATAKEDGALSDMEPPVPADRRLASKDELIAFMVDLLDKHGWDQWPDHLDGIKLLLFNSFPPLRKTSQEDKLVDIIRVFESHIQMAERSEFFEGAEDIGRVFL